MNARMIMAITTAIQVLAGAFVYFFVASIENIELFKLINVVGLSFDILGVLLLAKFFVDYTEKYRNVFEYVYAFLWAGLNNFPLGVIIASLSLFWLDLPSSNIVFSFAVGIFGYIAVPLFVLDYAGEIFQFGYYKSTKKRIVFMGCYLLATGLILQMVASVMDLIGQS